MENEEKNREKELNERVNSRTSAERVVHRQLHAEIDHHKQSERAIQDAREYAESIINAVHEPLIVLDDKLKLISANRSFYDVFKVNPEETTGQLIYDLGNRQWDIPKLRELLENILPQNTTFDNFEVEHDFPGIGKRTMLLNARQVTRPPGKPHIILLAIEDITESKNILDGLHEKIKQLEVVQRAAASKDSRIFEMKRMIDDLERRIRRRG